jgi:ABC-type polysaccharide/polyol phosphate export permease
VAAHGPQLEDFYGRALALKAYSARIADFSIPSFTRRVTLPSSKDIAKAVRDFITGIASIHVWPMLGWQEIRLRYRRSTLGPIWLTLSTGALIACMGPLYGVLLGHDIASYYPFLAVGYILWLLISSLMNEGCMVFISAESMIKQLPMPFSIHVLRMVWKNVVVFFHNSLIVAVVLWFFPPRLGWHTLLILPGVFVIALNGIWIATILGILCARFRDIPQLVQSIVQVGFFLTPVLWRPEALGRNSWIADWNPFYHFLELVRAPLLGYELRPLSLLVALAVTIGGYVCALMMFARYRARIAYWV